MRFWFSILCINKSVLSCWSFNFKCISNILRLCSPLLTIAGFDIIFMCGWFPNFTVCLPLLVSFPIRNFLVFSYGLSCLSSSLSICCKAHLVVLNSFSFCLSVKLLISPSNLNESLAGRVFLVVAFSFITLNILCHSLLACRVSPEKSADNRMEIPL